MACQYSKTMQLGIITTVNWIHYIIHFFLSNYIPSSTRVNRALSNNPVQVEERTRLSENCEDCCFFFCFDTLLLHDHLIKTCNRAYSIHGIIFVSCVALNSAQSHYNYCLCDSLHVYKIIGENICTLIACHKHMY